jgi:hypothetical protein
LRRIARLKEWEVIAQYDRDGIARPDPERGKPTGGPPRPATSMISSRETSRSPLMSRPVAISFTLTSPAVSPATIAPGETWLFIEHLAPRVGERIDRLFRG